jgi:opacity protein-like surface antigen
LADVFAESRFMLDYTAQQDKKIGRSCSSLMKKNSKSLALFAVSLFMLVFLASSAFAEVVQKHVNFGQDANKMQWYLMTYGKNDDGIHVATARKYYTNPDEKQKIIDLIVEKFGTEREFASGLYFTEYGYVYSNDGKSFAVTYLNHYNMVGKEIRSTVYPEGEREFIGMSSNMIPYKAYQYASGKKKPAK